MALYVFLMVSVYGYKFDLLALSGYSAYEHEKSKTNLFFSSYFFLGFNRVSFVET